jgi:hypothetical protein
VIDPEQVRDCCLQIVNAHASVGYVESEVVGGSVNVAVWPNILEVAESKQLMV